MYKLLFLLEQNRGRLEMVITPCQYKLQLETEVRAYRERRAVQIRKLPRSSTSNQGSSLRGGLFSMSPPLVLILHVMFSVSQPRNIWVANRLPKGASPCLCIAAFHTSLLNLPIPGWGHVMRHRTAYACCTVDRRSRYLMLGHDWADLQYTDVMMTFAKYLPSQLCLFSLVSK